MYGCSHGSGCCCGGGHHHYYPPTIPGCPWSPHPEPCHHHHPYSWVPASRGHVPANAVQAGHERGAAIYAARAWHEGDLIPAKVPKGHGCAFVGWNGKEHRKLDYEVLTSTHPVSWVHDRDGRVPAQALPVGHTTSGETLYMGRAHHMGTLTPGKVHPSHHCLYIPYGDKEIAHSAYEVLVVRC